MYSFFTIGVHPWSNILRALMIHISSLSYLAHTNDQANIR